MNRSKLRDLQEHEIEYIKVDMEHAHIKIDDRLSFDVWLEYENRGRSEGYLNITGMSVFVFNYLLDDVELDSDDLPQFILDEIVTYEQGIDHYQQDWLKRSDDAVKWAKEEGRAR